MIAYAFPNAPEKSPNALTHAHVTLNASMVVKVVIIISVTSVMISKKMKISTDAKIHLQTKLHNVWQHVVVHHHALSVVPAIMKLT
jgi:hypothetical protein